MDEGRREKRRRQIQQHARLRSSHDEILARTERLNRAAEVLSADVPPFRRALGALLGSRAWDALVRLIGRPRRALGGMPAKASASGELAEPSGGRRALDRAARRLGAYESGVAQLQGAIARTFSRRRNRAVGPGAAGESVPVRRSGRDRVAPSSIAIRVVAPNAEAAMRGGDYHLAHALVSDLRERGWRAVVETAEDDKREPEDGLRIVLRGRQAVAPRPNTVNILWIISHPDLVSEEELAGYDHVLVASEAHAHVLRRTARVPVSVLLQFADRPFLHADGERRWRNDLLFAGNWRGVYRRVVWDAHCLGRRPALVGDGWRYISPRDTIADHVAYADLPDLYRSTRILLVDHWDDMRDRGFVSNRVFDALASGTFLVADDVLGLRELLPEGLATYRSVAELDRLLDRYLANPVERARVAARGRELVLASHTVEHRVDELLGIVRSTVGSI